ncbi:MAG: T9SS type A sorting domain-containing protein [Bacteroidota bacterium]|nr:T9SS type A sorting domain-containing protein [Bacteroidota bacterium]
MKTKSNLLFVAFTCLFLCSGAQSFPLSWTSKGVGGGGAIVNAAISPFNNNEFFLTCDMSNLFHTTDFGQNYSMTHFNQLQAQVKTEVQFTSSQPKLFALSKTTGYVPVKSYNGGTNWLAATNPATLGSLYQYFASSHDTDQVVISDAQKIYFSNTENTAGPISFPIILNYPNAYGAHIAGVFFENKDTVYVCSHDSLIRTFNGGLTWTNVSAGTFGIPSNEHIVSFKGAKQGGKWVFYCVTILANAIQKIYKSSSEDYSYYKGVYKLSQGQTQWLSIGNNLPNPATDKVYLLGLANNDTSVVYVGGSSTSFSVPIGAIFKSMNGGNSFTNVFINSGAFNANSNVTTGWIGKQLSATARFKWHGISYFLALTVDPNNSGRLICGDQYVAHTSIDGGVNWTQAYTDINYDNAPSTLLNQTHKYKTSGLETTACYWLTWTSPTNIFASYNDILARTSTDGGQFWSYDIYGLDTTGGSINDINMTLVNPATGLIYAAAGEQPGSNADYTDARILQYLGRLSVSADSGKTWVVLKRFSHRAVTSIALDPNSINGMYVTVIDILGGIGDVYHCTDVVSNSNSWTRLASPPRTEGRALQILVLQNGDLVSVYGTRDVNPISPSNVFSASSGVFYSNNGGASWADVTPIGTTKETVNVEIDPNDATESTWLAFAGNKCTSPGVFRTTNKGQTWTPVYNGGVLSGSFHPSLPNELYICTEINGLQYATNTNSNSFSITPITSYPFRRPQKVFFNPYNVNEVWVASFGNGFRMGTTNLNTGIKNLEKENTLTVVYPNPANSHITVKLSVKIKPQDNLSIYDLIGQQVLSLNGLSGESVLINTTTLSSGTYILKVNTDGVNHTSKFIISR